MSKLSAALCCSALLLLGNGCNDSNDDFLGGGGGQVVGSGNIVTEMRTLPPFDRIEVRITGDVILTQAGTQSVRLDADDNIIQEITTTVAGSVLIVDSNISYRNADVTLTLSVTSVLGLRLSGAGSITGASIASVGTVEIVLDGAGTITASGTTDRLSATLSGTGTIDAENLTSRVAGVLLSGVGDVRVTATEELNATLTGLGNIRYGGSPSVVNKSVTGVGDVIPI